MGNAMTGHKKRAISSSPRPGAMGLFPIRSTMNPVTIPPINPSARPRSPAVIKTPTRRRLETGTGFSLVTVLVGGVSICSSGLDWNKKSG
jgi:hypothetical protein